MIKATRDMIIVKVIHDEKLGKGILYSPTTRGSQERNVAFYGEVLSVGPDFPYDVKVKDRIIFPRNEGIDIKQGIGDKDKIVALRRRWVLAKC